MPSLEPLVSRVPFAARLLGRPDSRLPPVVEEGLPIVGPARAFQVDPVGFLQRARRRHGDVFTVDLLVYRATFVLGPDAQRRFFAQPEEALSLTEAVDSMMVPIIGPQKDYARLTRHQDQVHDIIRRGLMKHDRLDTYLATIERVADSAVERWIERGEIDLFRECSRLVNHVNVATLVGEDARAEFGDAITEVIYALETDGIAPEVIAFPWLPTSARRRCGEARTRLREILGEFIRRRTAEPGDDYISLWLSERWPEGGPVTPVEFTSHLIGAFFAAHTNTTATLGWTLAEFAQNPRSLERARAEVAAFEAAHEDRSRYLDLRELVFAEACIREAVRKHFAVILMRRTMKDYEEGGHVIPKGNVVCISPLVTHLDPDVFPRPDVFDPDRFADLGNARKLERDGVFVQFGLGEHRCLGEMFALAVIKTALRVLVQRAELTTVEAALPSPDFSKTLGSAFPSAPIRVRVRLR